MLRMTSCWRTFKQRGQSCSFSCLSQQDETEITSILMTPYHQCHLIFGANTDVGKTIVSTGLVQESLRSNIHKHDHVTYYIKPLQCGGSDADFVRNHVIHQPWMIQAKAESKLKTDTIFNWKTPASPHLASRIENHPCSDRQVISALEQKLSTQFHSTPCNIFIESAGGVLSPSAASPLNTQLLHARGFDRNDKGTSSMSNSILSHSVDTTTEAHSWGWTTQADLYKQLLFPVVLVGDGRLGGISSTLSALESLIIRGYDVHGIVFIQDPVTENDFSYSNHLALREYVNRSVKLRSGLGKVLLEDPDQSIISLPSLPPLPLPLDAWFHLDETREKFESFNQLLTFRWNQYLQDVQEMRSLGKDMIWWPFTQHRKYTSNDIDKTNESQITLIDAAQGDYFHVLDNKNHNHEQDDTISYQKKSLFDGCASWWTQGIGHGDSTLSLATAAAAGRYGHVIFPDSVHSPAVSLCQLLLGPKGPGYEWAHRVFFSDDGSTAMEIAVKMGMRKFCVDRKIDIQMTNTNHVNLFICAQKGCYHGDTLGVMHVAEPNIFNTGQHPWYESRGLFLDFPIVRFRHGILEIAFPDGSIESRFKDIAAVYDINTRLSSDMYPRYFDSILNAWNDFEQRSPSSQIASVIVEPLLLGAGGMKFVDPLWQRALIDVARTMCVPVIFDEVASGLYRLGKFKSCREILRVNPDIAAYAKLLTGGLVPMSVTLATDDIFASFLGDRKSEALLHGHSYSAHPVGCAAAIHALEAYNEAINEQNNEISYFNESHVAELSTLASVQECMTLGTVLALKLSSRHGDTSSLVQSLVHRVRKKGCFIRPLGDIIYVMASLVTQPNDYSKIIRLLHDAIIDEESDRKKKNVLQSLLPPCVV